MRYDEFVKSEACEWITRTWGRVSDHPVGFGVGRTLTGAALQLCSHISTVHATRLTNCFSSCIRFPRKKLYLEKLQKHA